MENEKELYSSDRIEIYSVAKMISACTKKEDTARHDTAFTGKVTKAWTSFAASTPSCMAFYLYQV
jgi:hypothetical protein